mmetsp:Transcript_18586/g.33502  ORF Transcript_18586/g.33502 Transcript_18586/m.33502 type:complete len:221 (-) Transcript_18586:83-745(-)
MGHICNVIDRDGKVIVGRSCGFGCQRCCGCGCRRCCGSRSSSLDTFLLVHHSNTIETAATVRITCGYNGRVRGHARSHTWCHVRYRRRHQRRHGTNRLLVLVVGLSRGGNGLCDLSLQANIGSLLCCRRPCRDHLSLIPLVLLDRRMLHRLSSRCRLLHLLNLLSLCNLISVTTGLRNRVHNHVLRLQLIRHRRILRRHRNGLLLLLLLLLHRPRGCSLQ